MPEPGAMTLTIRTTSSRMEGLSTAAAEASYNRYHILPNLALRVCSRGRRHVGRAYYMFFDVNGRATDVAGWIESWSEIIQTKVDEKKTAELDDESIGLCALASARGRRAFASAKLDFDGPPEPDCRYKLFTEWKIVPKEGGPPVIVDFFTGTEAPMSGSTYDC